MLLTLDHHSGVPIYRQIVDQIRQHVLTARLSPGEQIVSVRDLAAELRVNPMTVSKAYAYLEMEGLLERRRGVGLFVAAIERRRKQRDQLRVLEEMLQKAAVAAVQMEIPEEEALELFSELYRKHETREGEKVR